MRTLRSPWQIQRDVVLALVLRELKTRFGARRLGALWLLLEPAAHVAALMFIFGYVRHIGPPGVDSSVFLLTGIVPFLLLKSIALRVMEGVEGNRGLFTYRVIKPMDAFVARSLLETILYLAVFFLLSGFLAWLGVDVVLHHPLAFIGTVLLVCLLGLGLGVVFCVLTDALPEVKPFIRLLFLPLYFLSGIIFPLALVPERYLDWLLWNPILHAVDLSRQAFFGGYRGTAEVSALFLTQAVLLVLFGALWIYRGRRLELIAR